MLNSNTTLKIKSISTFSLSFIPNQSTYQREKLASQKNGWASRHCNGKFRTEPNTGGARKVACRLSQSEGRSNEEETREKFYTARLHETRAKGHTFLRAFGSKLCGVARCRPKCSPNLSRRKLPRWSALCQAGCMVGNLCIRWRRCRDKSRCSLCSLLNPRGVQSVRPSRQTSLTDRAFGVACSSGTLCRTNG